MFKKIIILFKFLIIMIFIMLIVSFTVLVLSHKLPTFPADYTNSIYVITKNHKELNKYYEISNKRNEREIDIFNSDDYQIITFDVKKCFDAYIPEGKNQFLNVFLEEGCMITDEFNEYIELPNGILKDIAKSIGNIKHPPIFRAKIYKIDNHYYPIVNYNTNLVDPYELFYYDEEEKKLISIYEFEGEDIVGIKENTYKPRKEET